MNLEEQKYYDNYFDLFNSSGWKQLIKELEDIYETSYSVESLNTIEELHKSKGEREILSRLLNFENGIEAAYASLQSGNSET